MDANIEFSLGKAFDFYINTCSDDAKMLRDAIDEGRVVKMYDEIKKDLEQAIINNQDDFFYKIRILYFISYCIGNTNGKAFIEILCDGIDTGEDEFAINSSLTVNTFIGYIKNKGVDIQEIKELVHLKDIKEYATGNKTKSTKVLKKVIKHSEHKYTSNGKNNEQGKTKKSLSQEQRRFFIDSPLIYRYNKNNPNYLHDYLGEIKESFDLTSKTEFGAVCLALHIRKLFNPYINFKTLVEKLALYWDLEPPKDKRPNKYRRKKDEMILKYSILEKILK